MFTLFENRQMKNDLDEILFYARTVKRFLSQLFSLLIYLLQHTK